MKPKSNFSFSIFNTVTSMDDISTRNNSKVTPEKLYKMESMTVLGKPPKKAKNFRTVVNYGGGFSKFWCVNLKKVLF